MTGNLVLTLMALACTACDAKQSSIGNLIRHQSYYKPEIRRYDTQHNDTTINDTQHNDIQHNGRELLF